MRDIKLAHLLSDFFLDISKAYFIATFVTPALTGASEIGVVLAILTKGLVNVILFLMLAWQFATLEETL
ncbi:hypothetical protein HY086_02575 [Candidatus Gottesmanbacteria bacterium]|nr:hypothetical protein [Candidatus Gottesmanbacteria bacterium]